MSLSLKPEPRETLIMMATGADAAKRKATKAFKNSLSKTLYEPCVPKDVCLIELHFPTSEVV